MADVLQIQHMEQLLAIVFQAYQAASDGADVAEQTAWTVEVNKIFEVGTALTLETESIIFELMLLDYCSRRIAVP